MKKAFFIALCALIYTNISKSAEANKQTIFCCGKIDAPGNEFHDTTAIFTIQTPSNTPTVDGLKSAIETYAKEKASSKNLKKEIVLYSLSFRDKQISEQSSDAINTAIKASTILANELPGFVNKTTILRQGLDEITREMGKNNCLNCVFHLNDPCLEKPAKN